MAADTEVTRRVFLAGVSSLAVARGGLVSGGWQSSVSSLIIIDSHGKFTGLFVYDPAPGAGNLIASITAKAGTDPFGNAYLPGVNSYGDPLGPPFLDSQLFQGSLQFQSAATEAGPWSVLASMQGFGSSGTPNNNGIQVNGSIRVAGPRRYILLSPSGDATGVTDTNSLSSYMSSAGAIVILLPGTWNLNCGDANLTSLGPGQYIVGCGDLATIINAHGSGDLFYWSAPSPNSDGNTTGGGFIGGATIDGTACSGAATGIHAGDINALRFDCRCQHFNKTGGSWGFLFDNANTFTERMHLDIRAKDCGFAGSDGGMVGFTVSGATTSTASFSRLRARIELTQGSNGQDGVVLMAGAHIYDHELEIIGNFQGGAGATTAAVLRITGTVPALHPGAGTHSAISNGRLDIGAECSTGTHTPTTVVRGATSNSVTDTYGNVNFNNNFTSSGITGAGWKYDGQVQGDTALGTRRAYGEANPQTIITGGTIATEVTSAVIQTTNAGAITGVILNAGNEAGQVIWVLNEGAGAMQFAAAGSNIANPAAATIAAGSQKQFVWEPVGGLWYGP